MRDVRCSNEHKEKAAGRRGCIRRGEQLNMDEKEAMRRQPSGQNRQSPGSYHAAIASRVDTSAGPTRHVRAAKFSSSPRSGSTTRLAADAT